MASDASTRQLTEAERVLWECWGIEPDPDPDDQPDKPGNDGEFQGPDEQVEGGTAEIDEQVDGGEPPLRQEEAQAPVSPRSKARSFKELKAACKIVVRYMRATTPAQAHQLLEKLAEQAGLDPACE